MDGPFSTGQDEMLDTWPDERTDERTGQGGRVDKIQE